MGELQTFTRAELLGALTVERPVRQPDSARDPSAGAPRRPRPPAPASRGSKGRPRRLPPGGGPVVDIDMGIGREHGYRDPRRLGRVTVRPHPAIPELADPAAVGAAMATIRCAAGATQEAVGQLLGATNEVVSRWERGLASAPSHVRATWAQACRQAARQSTRQAPEQRPRRRRGRPT